MVEHGTLNTQIIPPACVFNYFASLTVPVRDLWQGRLRGVLGGFHEIREDHRQGFGRGHISYQEKSFQKGNACLCFYLSSIFSERPHPERDAGEEMRTGAKKNNHAPLPTPSLSLSSNA